ncbi:phytanoyl-CoA dioxygenase family protein [Nitratifractor sp.]|uniref:phytanoyl-CoA dioxygenase family protein n=1 Tax=Nitratifractor sp. TaxID=2268144 RepID=UPI0025F4BBC8|nr:phytanoyl-CoA dioxygenase family protein [Nitratifractor sp.]
MSTSITLSFSQIDTFQRDGLLYLPRLVDEERCRLIKELAQVHLNYRVEPLEWESEYIGIENEAYRSTVRRLRQVYDRDIVFRRWMEDPMLREALRVLLGDNPILVLAHHNSIMTKAPGTSTQTRWHQDIRYWNYRDDRLLSVWLALGEENAENGVLEFIPGSQRMELSRERFDEKIYFRDDLEENRELIEKRVSFRLSPGDVVLFHAKTLHRADFNRSDRTKFSFVYTVRAADNPPIPATRSSAFREIELPL